MIEDWNDVRFFMAVANAGKLSGAAQALGVDPSTVFRKLNKLEDGLGSRLFERHKQGYRLTAAGRTFMTHAERMTDELGKLNLSLAGQDVRAEGLVRVTTTHSAANMLIAPLLNDFLAKYPEIRVSISIAPRFFDLGRYQADVAIRATLKPPEHLLGRKLGTYTWMLFGAKEYLDENGAPKNVEALNAHRVLMPNEELASIRMMRHLNQALGGQDARQAIASNDLHFIYVAVTEGLGLGLLPEYFANYNPRLKAVRIPEVEQESDLWMLVHPDQADLTRIRVFTQYMAENIDADRLKLS